MKTPMKRALLPILAGGVLFGLAACDTNDVVDCDTDPNAPGCEEPLDFGSTVYDTTGTVITITDNGDGVALPGAVTWSDAFTYVLDGRVIVNEGQTLTIEPGTVVQGMGETGANASVLIVARDGRIVARGTASDPIVFTAEGDDVDDATDEPTPGSWGGLIVLGTARLNTTPGVKAIEGIPTTEERALYGCGDEGFACDDADDSGVLEYVSIRYGGITLEAENEINGLTLGGVGSGTTINHVEVFGNTDDGVEFFGGTVNTKRMAVTFIDGEGDDGFDTDFGYRGRGQFWLVIQQPESGNNGAEMDGGDVDAGQQLATPWSTPEVWNATFIGGGVDFGDLGRAVRIRENSAPSYHRSYFLGFDEGIRVDEGGSADSRARLDDGTIELGSLLFGSFVNGDEPEAVNSQAFVRDAITNGRYLAGTLGIGALNAARTSVDPTATGPALSDLGPAPTGSFFENAACMGAVCPGDDWLEGWTALDRLGLLAN